MNPEIDSHLLTNPPPRYVERAFGTELELFPHLRSVDFRFAFGGVPWYILKECLSHRNITAISFFGSDWTCVSPPPKSALKFILRHRLKAFSYAAWEWREIQIVQTDESQSRLDAAYKLEAEYLRSFVLGMADSVESLTLPIETSPLARMSSLDWPRLQSLTLDGPHFDPALSNILPALLSRMPSLRSLSVQVHPRRGLPRPLLVTSMSTGGWSRQLRALSIGYPVPEDNIFSLVTELTHLSLRDTPRYYLRDRHRLRMPMSERPLLSATACLDILRRMSIQRLRSLELSYREDGSEDELLQYLASRIPKLQVLELHRYAATEPDPEDAEPAEVPYTHIAHALTSIRNLRIAHLDFDLDGDSFMLPWHDLDFREEEIAVLAERGRAISDILSACPQFEYVSLLSHQYEGGKWVLFRPPWHGELVNRLDLAPRYHQ
ncbi:hypothetical protein BD413DRAFT_473621 [Trametes elegans]|nr:hypothetical protein BD413DRAFT_473621 [Trametes elegans]